MARRAATRKNRSTRKNKTMGMMGRKNKTMGMMGGMPNESMGMGDMKKEMMGGKRRKTGTKRKLSPALKAWNEKVMKAFKAGRAKNPKYKLMDAMKDAKKQK
jgi:hypothetical protein